MSLWIASIFITISVGALASLIIFIVLDLLSSLWIWYGWKGFVIPIVIFILLAVGTIITHWFLITHGV